MKLTCTNIYYFYFLNIIGGTETFLYQLAKKYQDYDIAIVYTRADPDQLARLKKYVKCIEFRGQEIYCKNAFFNYGIDIINHVHAEKYSLVVHADYEAILQRNPGIKLPIHPKITQYIGVSKKACEAFTKVTGKPCKLCYNPFTVEEPKKVLHLISATRLSREKGKDRMRTLMKLLDEAGIPFLWTIFTNDKDVIDNPSAIYMQPRLDITGYIKNADYLVQLSNDEGYCYSVVEALTQDVPVIVTKCPVFDELGLENGKNCYLLDFDMTNVPLDDIYNKIPKNFNYQPLKDCWDTLFEPTKGTYQEDLKKTYTVRALPAYKEMKKIDAGLGRVPKIGEEWNVDYNRMITLTGDNKYQVQFVEVVKEIKPL